MQSSSVDLSASIADRLPVLSMIRSRAIDPHPSPAFHALDGNCLETTDSGAARRPQDVAHGGQLFADQIVKTLHLNRMVR